MGEQNQGPPDSRIERDTLGEVTIPQHALYGIQTVRASHNLSFSGKSLRDYPVYVRSLAKVKRSAAIANHQCAQLSTTIRDAIVEGCDQIISGLHHDHFIVDVFAGGGNIAINNNVNEVIANLANERLDGKRGTYSPVDPKKHVNMCQSTVDVCHTAANIAVLQLWLSLAQQIEHLVQLNQDKARQFQDVSVIARTCLQDATTCSLGSYFGAVARMVNRRHKELSGKIDLLKEVNLGGTAIGSGEGASEAYRAIIVDILRENCQMDLSISKNLFDVAQHIDNLATIASGLSLLAGSLIKVAKDIRLMASGPAGGFAEIVLPSVMEGSTFFAGKINPVVPETLIHCCFLVRANEHAVFSALEHGELNLNVFAGVAAALLQNNITMLKEAVFLFNNKCLAGIESQKVRSSEYEANLTYLNKLKDSRNFEMKQENP